MLTEKWWYLANNGITIEKNQKMSRIWKYNYKLRTQITTKDEIKKLRNMSKENSLSTSVPILSSQIFYSFIYTRWWLTLCVKLGGQRGIQTVW